MRSKLVLVLALAMVGLVLVPWSVHAAGILRIAQNTSDLRSMDPHFATTT